MIQERKFKWKNEDPDKKIENLEQGDGKSQMGKRKSEPFQGL
jgi:hypothetical protein